MTAATLKHLTRVAIEAGADRSLSYLERGNCNRDREATSSRSERPLPAAPGSRSGQTVFKAVGVAMQHWTIARLLAERRAKQEPQAL